MFDQREELPPLPFGNPIGFVPASRGGVYIESTDALRHGVAFLGTGLVDNLFLLG